MTQPDTQAESGQRAFLHRILNQAATQMGTTIDGRPVFGWHDRTIGAPVTRGGQRWWLRATAEHEQYAHGEQWTGNADAAILAGIPKPTVVDRAEWNESEVAIYAELMTFVAAPPCSLTPELRTAIDLPDTWWRELRSAVDTLGRTPVDRPMGFGEHGRPQQEFFGTHVPPPSSWATEHADLHWANLTHPDMTILDWEFWGRAPQGYGAALLHCHSLLVPEIAERVYALFADLLNTSTGRYAELSAIAYLLRRADGGDYPDLAAPLRARAETLLSAGIERP